jgi:TAG lipase / lysophosphatidylethanolamine acyltransferase
MGKGINTWVMDDCHPDYNWKELRRMKEQLHTYRQAGNESRLRSRLGAQVYTRNVCDILKPQLYRKSNIQTKRLIQEYIFELRRCIVWVTERCNMNGRFGDLQAHEMCRLIMCLRTSLGRTSLVLQGGAMISTSHLGVVRALHSQRVLPRVITGMSTGALVAALVCITTDENLPTILDATNINLDVFNHGPNKGHDVNESWFNSSFIETIKRRYHRYRTSHHVFDIGVLNECTRVNLGDITFEEAYAKTGRVLNITIAMSPVAGTPQLLNFLTAPKVLIRTAVVASIATSRVLYAPVQLLCKDKDNEIKDYFAADFVPASAHRASVHRKPALNRIGELFNVNQFIISQTRPYIAPFIQLQAFADRLPFFGRLTRVVLSDGLFWLKQLHEWNVLPVFLQRIMMDEVVPNLRWWSIVYITPDIRPIDVVRMFETPMRDNIREWANRGERATWPHIAELKIRCGVELEMDTAYTSLRRTGALQNMPPRTI